MNAPFPPSGKPPLRLLLAAPRGFCAGVDRAIDIVELALQRYGAPVYVRHEIVHNRYVVEALKAKGAIFVEELDEVPDGVPVVFSAHGVPKAVPAMVAVAAEAWARHRQSPSMINRGKINELYFSGDWVVRGDGWPRADAIRLEEGMAETFAWYRAHGWLPPAKPQ